MTPRIVLGIHHEADHKEPPSLLTDLLMRKRALELEAASLVGWIGCACLLLGICAGVALAAAWLP